jgi:hypothetical protein
MKNKYVFIKHDLVGQPKLNNGVEQVIKKCAEQNVLVICAPESGTWVGMRVKDGDIDKETINIYVYSRDSIDYKYNEADLAGRRIPCVPAPEELIPEPDPIEARDCCECYNVFYPTTPAQIYCDACLAKPKPEPVKPKTRSRYDLLKAKEQ